MTRLDLVKEIEEVRGKIESCVGELMNSLRRPLTDDEYWDVLSELEDKIHLATEGVCEMNLSGNSVYELEVSDKVGSTEIEAYSFRERYPVVCSLPLGKQMLTLEIRGVHIAVVYSKRSRAIKVIEGWSVYELCHC